MDNKTESGTTTTTVTTEIVTQVTSNKISTEKRKVSSESTSDPKKIKKSDEKVNIDPYKYMAGLGNEHASEALPGSLPIGQNTPQKCAYGLYAEQLSGTSFTTPRGLNQRTWFYRSQPNCKHLPYVPATKHAWDVKAEFSKGVTKPNRIRWLPFAIPEKTTDFVEGLHTVGGSGDASTKIGFAIHMYTCNTSMKDKAFLNSDGDFLIVPQQGILKIQTEFGYLQVSPGQISVIQRGIIFNVAVDGPSRGYICEVFEDHFQLPELGPIGANGLANARDFEVPTAAFEVKKCKYMVYNKFLGELFVCERDQSPFDVVAWHGSYYPYKYDTKNFCALNSVTFDHIDPSIFTVLTCPTSKPGVACIDFVIFPPRWCVQDNTFRPPYYHRNCMTEFMGNIRGAYEAKPKGFLPGSASLHSCMSGHGPAAEIFEKASNAELKPQYLFKNALAFMFESTYIMRLTEYGNTEETLEHDYYKCWQGLKTHFVPNNPK